MLKQFIPYLTHLQCHDLLNLKKPYLSLKLKDYVTLKGFFSPKTLELKIKSFGLWKFEKCEINSVLYYKL